MKETKVPKDFYTKLTKDFSYGEGKSRHTAPALKCDWSAVRKKLFTKEDPIYLHKTFGLFALCSFAYRYFYCLPMYGTLGFEGHWFDHLTIFFHLCLSSSSLIFEVLQQRIINKPLIIWEEYRLHAIVFTLRTFSTYWWGYLKPFEPESIVGRILQFCMIFAHHLVVDEITRRYGPEDKT